MTINSNFRVARLLKNYFWCIKSTPNKISNLTCIISVEDIFIIITAELKEK